MRTRLFWVLILCAFLGACATNNSTCRVRRAALDIGSASTKLKVADVNLCDRKIYKVVLEESAKVPYADDLMRNQKHFSSAVMAQGVKVVQGLMDRAKEMGAVEFVAVATEAFREAANAAEMIDVFKSEAGLHVQIIEQEQEAMLGFLGATAEFPGGFENIVVWDIGGSSQQITTVGRKGFENYFGKMASVGFRDEIISAVQNKKLSATKTPNPISWAQRDRALKVAHTIGREVPELIKDKITDPAVTIIGIGSVHNISIHKQAAPESNDYTRTQVEEALKKRIGKTDAQVGGAYASTDVSNLILVLGMMEALKIDNVVLRNVNLTDARLILKTLPNPPPNH